MLSAARIFLITLALASQLTGSAEAGINVWTTKGPPGGHIKALAIDPITPNILYAGTDGGGVFDMTQGTEICDDPNAVVQDQIFPSGSFVICTASQSITTQGMVDVQSGANVAFVSPSIRLNPGFSAEFGSIFRALNPVVLTLAANTHAKSTLRTSDRAYASGNGEDLGSVTVPSSHRLGIDALPAPPADALRSEAAQVTDLFSDDAGSYVVFSTEGRYALTNTPLSPI